MTMDDKMKQIMIKK